MARSAKATAAIVLGAIVACGDLGPGDSLVYRVAYGPGQLGADCFDGPLAASPPEDTTTFHDAGTLILYFDGSGAPRLDAGRVVLVGSGGDDAYDFEGERIETVVVPGETIVDTDRDGIPDGEDPFVDADMDGVDDATDDFVDTDEDGIDDRNGDPFVDVDGDGIDDRTTELPSNTKLVDATRFHVAVALGDDLIDGEVRIVTESRCVGDCPGQPADSTCTTTVPFSGVRVDDIEVNVAPGNAPFD